MAKFQEADILWPENECDKEANSESRSAREGHATQRKLSDPIKIPPRSAFAVSDSCNVEDDDRGSDGNVIPPHVINTQRKGSESSQELHLAYDRIPRDMKTDAKNKERIIYNCDCYMEQSIIARIPRLSMMDP
ncbi:hypothetical protein GW17_00007119 [Ensete ventricosum]|nr:hypothetical protein GW17_00007119 [Ensete ventricosum]